MTVHDSKSTFEEQYVEGESGSFTKDDTDLTVWANELVARFNKTLRPGERKRFLDTIAVDEVTDKPRQADEDDEDDEDDEEDDEDEEYYDEEDEEEGDQEADEG